MKKSLFIGGSTSDSQWRQKLISKLNKDINVLNPTSAKELNEDARNKDSKNREDSDFSLYAISPQSIDPYTIAHLVDESNKRPESVVFAMIEEGGTFDKSQKNSMSYIKDLVETNGSNVFTSIDEAANYLNEQVKETATA